MSGALGERLLTLFQRSADEAAAALSTWAGRPASIAVRSVEFLTLEAVAAALGEPDEPACCAAMQVSGPVAGILVLATDDRAGWALADLLLGRPVGTSAVWGEVERSAILETANIVGCAYLNAVAASLPRGTGRPAVDQPATAVVPTPPLFLREYAAAVMEALVSDQAALADAVFLTRTAFSLDGVPVRCALVFVPDASTRTRIVDDFPPPAASRG